MDKNIQYILEVARCGGITRAAEKLYITPSALSKFVQAREEEMNIRLFRRLGKKFVLTDAGQYYVRKCEEIERIQNEMDQQMKHLANLNNNIICLGVQPSFSDVTLRKVIPEFQKHYPKMKVILQEYPKDQLISMIKNQKIDVALATTDKKETDLEYRKVKLCQIVMAVRKDHSLLEKTEKKTEFSYPWINLKQCAAEENVMLLPGSLFRKIADEVYAKAEAEPNIVYQISGTRTGLACVAYNHGVMITLDHMIFNNVFAEQILPLSIGEKPMYTDLDLVYMKDTVLTKEIETLKNIMTEAIQ